MKTSRFILQNIALRAMGLTKVPPYWLFREKITWKAVVGAVVSVLGVSLFFLDI